MARAIIILAAICLSGCAQWQQMTPNERKVVWASVGTAAFLGAVAGYQSGDDETVISVSPDRIKSDPTGFQVCRHPNPKFCK